MYERRRGSSQGQPSRHNRRTNSTSSTSNNIEGGEKYNDIYRQKQPRKNAQDELTVANHKALQINDKPAGLHGCRVAFHDRLCKRGHVMAAAKQQSCQQVNTYG